MLYHFEAMYQPELDIGQVVQTEIMSGALEKSDSMRTCVYGPKDPPLSGPA